MGRRIKKSQSLGSFFFKYVLLLLVTDLVIAALAAIVVIYASAYKLIYPANYEEQLISASLDSILVADSVTPDMIPNLCEYALFDLDGNVIVNTMPEEEIPAVLYCIKNNQSFNSYKGNYYYVIMRADEYCVIRYQLEPQFASDELRSKIKHPQRFFILLILFFLAFSLILYSIIFGKLIKKKLKPILDATGKIKEQDLDFEINYGNVKEINDILHAIDSMKKELKTSLETQWKNEELKKNQISSLAHDLKTPLTIVKGNNELLYEMDPTDEQKECLDFISEYSEKMSEYIQALITTNKSETAIKPGFEYVAATEFFNEINKEALALCKTSGVNLDYSCNVTRDIYINKDLLLRAIMNVVDNGVSYSPNDGTLTISVSDERDKLLISVTDQGPGFSKEAEKYATSQFYMDDKSRSGQKHYGIGLYEANETAKLHNGSLTVGGNTVTIIIS